MTRPPLYPLRFEPIFKHNLWGGQRLPGFLRATLGGLTHQEPIGEAWVLSDVDGNASRVANGALAGTTLRELLSTDPERILGLGERRGVSPTCDRGNTSETGNTSGLRLDARRSQLINGRFPLLLKFIDARQELSVQVHPNDEQAAKKQPGANGKTEAWVILDANSETSRIYTGFQPGITADAFRTALKNKCAPDTLHSFQPNRGDCVFLEAGTVHAIGADILLFEVQQTSDITYRLYDWDRVDAKTGLPRELHVENGVAVANFTSGPCRAVEPVAEERPGVKRERLVQCEYFTLDRITADRRFTVGAPGQCRVVITLDADGRTEIEWEDVSGLATGDVVLIPAEVGECSILPAGTVTVLEVGLPS